jgi:hypothetical protein
MDISVYNYSRYIHKNIYSVRLIICTKNILHFSFSNIRILFANETYILSETILNIAQVFFD